MPREFTDAERAKAGRTAKFRAAEQRIRRIVDSAPELTERQRETLARILMPDVTDDVA